MIGRPTQTLTGLVQHMPQASLQLQLVLGRCLVAYVVGRRELVRVRDVWQRLWPGRHRRDTRAATCHRRVDELAVLDAPGKELVCGGVGLRRPAHARLLPAAPRAALVARLARQALVEHADVVAALAALEEALGHVRGELQPSRVLLLAVGERPLMEVLALVAAPRLDLLGVRVRARARVRGRVGVRVRLETLIILTLSALSASSSLRSSGAR